MVYFSTEIHTDHYCFSFLSLAFAPMSPQHHLGKDSFLKPLVCQAKAFLFYQESTETRLGLICMDLFITNCNKTVIHVSTGMSVTVGYEFLIHL